MRSRGRLAGLALLFQTSCGLAPGRQSTRPRTRLHAAPLADQLEAKAESLKCPFFRRRFLDAADAARQSTAWLAARHKSILGFMYTPSVDAPSHVWTREETLKAIRNDFMNKYYVTGRLSLDHYHPRCFFDCLLYTSPSPRD